MCDVLLKLEQRGALRVKHYLFNLVVVDPQVSQGAREVWRNAGQIVVLQI